MKQNIRHKGIIVRDDGSTFLGDKDVGVKMRMWVKYYVNKEQVRLDPNDNIDPYQAKQIWAEFVPQGSRSAPEPLPRQEPYEVSKLRRALPNLPKEIRNLMIDLFQLTESYGLVEPGLQPPEPPPLADSAENLVKLNVCVI